MEKQRRSWRPVLVFGCALAVLLAGCGVTTADDTGGTSSTSTSPAAAAATATAAASGATSGTITLAVGASQYSASDRIVVTIRNDSGATVYAQQHNTSCSMILLERLVNGAWQPVYPCFDGFPHPTIGQVAAGSTRTVPLIPVITGDVQAAGGIQWQAGTYRAMLTYVTNQTTAFSHGTNVYSATFSVA